MAEVDATDGVITTCATAVAETGTLILDGAAGMGRRMITLIPDYHLCIVLPDQICADVPQALTRLDADPTADHDQRAERDQRHRAQPGRRRARPANPRSDHRRRGQLMPRYCLLGHVDPKRLDEYREVHRAVWPELLEALRDAGWRNYSLFLRDDGLLIGYAEADDLARAQEQVAQTEVNARWQQAMGDLFVTEGAPDEAWEIVPEVFNLEDQLARP